MGPLSANALKRRLVQAQPLGVLRIQGCCARRSLGGVEERRLCQGGHRDGQGQHGTADPSSIPNSATKTIKIYDTGIAAPEGLSGKTFSLTSSSVGTSPKLTQGHIDNSSESTLGEGDSITRYTTSGAIATTGEANSQVTYNAGAGTLSAIVDGSADGAITFDGNDNTGTNQSLVVVDELDFNGFDNDGDATSSATSIYAPGLYSGFRARISKSSLTTGVHTYKLSHSTTGNTSVLQFVKDNLTGTPVMKKLKETEFLTFLEFRT